MGWVGSKAIFPSGPSFNKSAINKSAINKSACEKSACRPSRLFGAFRPGALFKLAQHPARHSLKAQSALGRREAPPTDRTTP